MHSREAWARKLPEASCDLKSTLAALLFLAATLPASAVAQEPVLELDHVFIVVPPGGAEAIEALRQSGITVDTEVIRHEGQGTASVSALFENAYIELLWVDSSVAVDSAHQLDVMAFRRAAAWRETGSSPFGIGLHLLSGDASDLRVPYHLLSISGTQLNYVLLRETDDSLAPDVFVVPAPRAVTSWLDRYRQRHPESFIHSARHRRITRVSVPGPQRFARLDVRLVEFVEHGGPAVLKVEFDDGVTGQTRDLRPALPVILSR